MPHDQIRKQWLTLLFINPFISISLILLQFQTMQLPPFPGAFRYIFYSILFVTPMAMLYAMYHFCYKKRGTKFLAFILLTSIPSTLYTVYAHWNNLMPQQFMEIPYYKPMYMLSAVFSLFWLAANFRLWQANREWRKSA